MKYVLDTSPASHTHFSVSLPREMEAVLHHGLRTYHRRTALATGGKWVNSASLVERTVRAKKRRAEDSFRSRCVEGAVWWGRTRWIMGVTGWVWGTTATTSRVLQ